MIDVKIDIKNVTDNLHRLKRGLPFAMNATINQLAFDIMRSQKQALPKQLKLTRAFLPRQIRVAKSSPRTLEAQVGFTKAANLIDKLTTKSSRSTRIPFGGGHIAVPVNVKRTGKRGISKANRPKALLQKPNYFLGTFKGIYGIWHRLGATKKFRQGHKISLIYVLKSKTEYKGGKVAFFQLAEKVIKRRYYK